MIISKLFQKYFSRFFVCLSHFVLFRSLFVYWYFLVYYDSWFYILWVIFAWMYLFVYTHTHTCAYVFMHVYMCGLHVYLFVWVCMCELLCVCVLSFPSSYYSLNLVLSLSFLKRETKRKCGVWWPDVWRIWKEREEKSWSDYNIWKKKN